MKIVDESAEEDVVQPEGEEHSRERTSWTVQARNQLSSANSTIFNQPSGFNGVEREQTRIGMHRSVRLSCQGSQAMEPSPPTEQRARVGGHVENLVKLPCHPVMGVTPSL